MKGRRTMGPSSAENIRTSATAVSRLHDVLVARTSAWLLTTRFSLPPTCFLVEEGPCRGVGDNLYPVPSMRFLIYSIFYVRIRL